MLSHNFLEVNEAVGLSDITQLVSGRARIGTQVFLSSFSQSQMNSLFLFPSEILQKSFFLIYKHLKKL